MTKANGMLTPQEHRVAMAVSLGWRNKRIAESLGISERTVKKHVASACQKVNAEGRVQLALWMARAPSQP
ncbi:MAG: helix-turn-helix transcriptional regulator [Acidobacteriota bacterium]|nr:helix-turn-helix transcriptional regulator [Acidobacteriota bacterium]